MASVKAAGARRRQKPKARQPVSLADLLRCEDYEAEELVQGASASEKQLLLAEFTAYHQGCLLSTIRVDSAAVNDLIRFTKTCVSLIDFNLAVSKLIEIASYYENTGNIDKAVLIAEESLTYAESISDNALQRKAYSRLGACYSRQFDFERSCICYENALKLAIAVGDPLYEFAVLSNVATLFDAMGLRREASQLALKLSVIYPGGTKELDLLHLQNSINGFRFAFALKNAAEMRQFHACSSLKMRSVREVPEIWKAYFEANCVTCLIHDKKLEEARARLDSWFKGEKTSSNIRVIVSLLSASVECALEMGDKSWLYKLEESLREALPSSKTYPPDYELVLSLLALVHENKHYNQESPLGHVYTRRLQDHVVNVRHRQFFRRLSCGDVVDSKSEPTLINPVYNLTTSMFELRPDVINASWKGSYASDDFFAELEGRISRSGVSIDERVLRSTAYCIAENWAVAAEFGCNGDGAHCFLVGAIAHKVAAALDLDSSRCLEIELACRLHDIGKVGIPVALSQKVPRAEWHNSVYLREHPTIGERLLQSSSDQVLDLASRIARSHHEWWNGHGYPDALSGESIPVEARICAVASEYSALVKGGDYKATWSHDEAISQITTMAGIQLDPSIVRVFIGISGLASYIGALQGAPNRLEGNSLKIAKANLEACLSSI